jgi:hypothetical protein
MYIEQNLRCGLIFVLSLPERILARRAAARNHYFTKFDKVRRGFRALLTEPLYFVGGKPSPRIPARLKTASSGTISARS